MAVLAIPNVSEGRDHELISNFMDTVSRAGARVLDVHSDADHNRSVFTVSASRADLVGAMARLAEQAAAGIDLTTHEGVHPRLGVLDVCPFVPHERPMADAVAAAEEAAQAIHDLSGLPVYLYGEAARSAATRDLPTLRKGGLQSLIQRAGSGLPPDLGSADIDPRRGCVCVGAREPLIAFNVNCEATASEAQELAGAVRANLPAVRALGFAIGKGAQVSMNLIDPQTTGIDEAFEVVEEKAQALGVLVVGTEIVGLVPERYMPDPDAKAARLLIEPGRSLEAALRR